MSFNPTYATNLFNQKYVRSFVVQSRDNSWTDFDGTKAK